MDSLWVLAGAGFAAGAMNALAGGGSFVSLPALIAVGVPPVLANTTSTVALYPGSMASAWAYRDSLSGVGEVSLRPLLIVTLLGGIAGKRIPGPVVRYGTLALTACITVAFFVRARG